MGAQGGTGGGHLPPPPACMLKKALIYNIAIYIYIYIYIYNLTNFLSAFSGKYSLISLFLYIESYIVI